MRLPRLAAPGLAMTYLQIKWNKKSIIVRVCGTKTNLQEKFHKLRAVCPNCGWIYFADPKVAAAVLVEQDERVLLVRRVNEPFRGFWTLPAGFVDAGEDPARAAERECLEETSLTVRVMRVMDVIARTNIRVGGLHHCLCRGIYFRRG